jgi:excisionase family DNA binding protein
VPAGRLVQLSAELDAQPDLFSIKQAAARLGVSADTVYRLARRAELVLVHPTPGSSRSTGRSIDRYLERIGA